MTAPPRVRSAASISPARPCDWVTTMKVAWISSPMVGYRPGKVQNRDSALPRSQLDVDVQPVRVGRGCRSSPHLTAGLRCSLNG